MQLSQIVLVLVLCYHVTGKSYDPTWTSLDSRPLPQWYDQDKIGIFLHWGVFSVPGFSSEWFWWCWKGRRGQDCIKYMQDNFRPGFTYADFAPDFRAQFFNATEWAEIFRASGARYLVLTSKHHEGFCNWKSNSSWNWNSVDTGPGRDLVGDMKQVAELSGLRFGLYHSLFEWFNPLYLRDKSSNFKTQDFVKYKTAPELFELINKYHPHVIWSDGDWETTDQYWNSTHFLAWLYNQSPVRDTVVTNDRWGQGTLCKHGGFYTCQDRYNPGVLLKHKWENAMTLDRQSWGYRYQTQLADVISIDQLLLELASTVSCGGNLLINVGPTPDGRIAPIYEERLRQLGDWLSINGEAIYKTRPWRAQNDSLTPDVWYTSSSDLATVYAMFFNWPSDSWLPLATPTHTSSSSASMLGWTGGTLKIESTPRGMKIQLPTNALIKLHHAWTIKLMNVK